MKRKTIVGIALGVLLIGIVTAGLVPYLSNTVTATIEVKGPVFYPNGHIVEKYYELKINEVPDAEEITLIDGENIIFKTSSLGVDSFYSAEYTIYIRAKTNVEGNKLLTELWILDEDDNYKQRICETNFSITATQYFSTKTQTCQGSQLILDEDDRFALKIYGAGETSNYTLRVGDYSTKDKIMRIEVSAT